MQLRRAVALAPTCLLLAGCLSIHEPRLGAGLEPVPGTAIVVGRIRVIAATGEQFPWAARTLDLEAVLESMGVTPPPMSRPLLAVFSVDRAERNLAPAPDEAGWFCWELPPGRQLLYVMDDLHGGDAPEPSVVAPWPVVLAAFAAGAGPGAQYLGELVIEVQADWAAGEERADYDIVQVSVTAAPEAAQRWIEARFPGSPPALEGPFMVADPRLSDLLRDWSRERAEPVLRGLGVE